MNFKFLKFFGFAAITAFGLLTTSCNKDATGVANVTPTSTSVLTQSIVVAVDSTKKDSVHICLDHEDNGEARKFYRDTTTFAALPTAIGTYLTTNYAGYKVTATYIVKDTVANTSGYVVIFTFNNLPVAILFDKSGAFVKVLEQRSSGDNDGNGPGGHHGDGPMNGGNDRFGDRDGLGRDSVSYSILPASVKTYLTANYKLDTFRKAFKDPRTGNYVVVTNNNGLFVTTFTSAGVFVSHLAIPTPAGKGNDITAAQLPAAITTYLKATYPAYVFKEGDVFKDTTGAITGYEILIDASGTKYEVRFDAAGKFVSATVVH